MNKLYTLFDTWWEDFRKGNPTATAAYKLLCQEEGSVLHDHIALRTFNEKTVNIDMLMRPFLTAGYACKDKYEFPKTHISAQHYEHQNPVLPKIFVSQLHITRFSSKFQAVIDHLLNQIPSSILGTWDFFVPLRPWKPSFSDYKTLYNESAYAAWVVAFGFRPTHFAVGINSFNQYASLKTFNLHLKKCGFSLNTATGEIQGTKKSLLEQSSLEAAIHLVDFSEGTYPIKGTYYEFAKRYHMPNGNLFNGFQRESAENLFQNTNS